MDHHDLPADLETTRTVSPQELLQHLRGYEGGLPEAMWRPLVAAGTTLVPALIAMVEEALADDHADLGWAPLHAAVDLLGVLGDARAVPCAPLPGPGGRSRPARPACCRRVVRASAPSPSTAVSWRMPRRPGTPSAIGCLAS